jgi:hypothetical protein
MPSSEWVPFLDRHRTGQVPLKDAREGDFLEEFGRDLLAAQFDRLVTLIPREDWVAPAVIPDSRLDFDSRATGYDPIRDQIVFSATVAADHLFTLREAIAGASGRLPAMAPFTLMRASVENSARGISLLSGGTRSKRVLTALQSTWTNRHHVEPLAIALGLQNPQGLAQMEKRLIEIRDNRKGIPSGASLETRTKITSIIAKADRMVTTGQLSGLDVWRAGSGIAHGNQTMVLMMLERSWNEAEKGYRFTAPISVVGWMLETCVSYLDFLLRSYDEANSALERTEKRRI